MRRAARYRAGPLRLVLALMLALGGLTPRQAEARAGPCRLALVLALDVSSSVSAQEYVLQRDGLAAALRDAEIRAAILRGSGQVALAIYEWSGRRQSALVSDWTLLDSHAAIDRVVTRLLRHPRSETRFPTAMGYALGYGATLLARGPRCDRKVIDLSGDGRNNDGFPPDAAYRHFPFAGVTVNGLAVLGADDTVLGYFQRVLRFGPGAFVETAQGYAGYRRAMTRKLFRELNGLAIGARPVTAPGPG